MSDKFLNVNERYAARQEAKFQARVENARRLQRIRQYEAELQQVKNDMEDSGPIDFAKQFLYSTVVGGVQDALKAGNEKAADLAGWATERAMSPGEMMVRGLGAKPGITAAQAGEAVAEKLDVMQDVESIPTMTGEGSAPAAMLSENLTRAMVSFFALYGPAVKIIGRTGQSRMASDIYAGTVADMWAFENKQGTFSDLARDLGIENEATQFLSGELSENEFEASLKAGMEGAMIGGAFYGIAKVYRILRDGYSRFGRKVEANAT